MQRLITPFHFEATYNGHAVTPSKWSAVLHIVLASSCARQTTYSISIEIASIADALQDQGADIMAGELWEKQRERQSCDRVFPAPILFLAVPFTVLD